MRIFDKKMLSLLSEPNSSDMNKKLKHKTNEGMNKLDNKVKIKKFISNS